MAGQLAVVTSQDGWETPPPLGVEQGSAFGYADRMFYGWSEDGAVFDYGDWAAQDLVEMMKRDYQGRKIESALSLPIMSAERHIIGVKGDKGENDWLNGYWEADPFEGGCRTELDEIIGANTTAITFRKAFYELVFKLGYEDKIVYDKVAFRPQTTCRSMRNPKNGDLIGFEQEPYAISPGIQQGIYPIQIPMKRAYVYVHGRRLNPLDGTSDLEVAHWCYKTKQKLLFLWMQFLESVALPRTVVKHDDPEIAKQIAAQVARMRGSAVIPIGTQGSANVDVATLDSSGKGAGQFKEAISWLDTAATQSVLAGFLDLTAQAAAGRGSYALSKDASNLFLQFEEAKTREIEKSIRKDLFGPLIRYNFGAQAKIPKLQFEPLNAEDKSDQIAMLNALMSSKGSQYVPDEFIAMLAQQVATYFGMDGDKIHDSFISTAAQAAQQAKEMGVSVQGQTVAKIAAPTQAASAMMRPAAQRGGKQTGLEKMRGGGQQ